MLDPTMTDRRKLTFDINLYRLVNVMTKNQIFFLNLISFDLKTKTKKIPIYIYTYNVSQTFEQKILYKKNI